MKPKIHIASCSFGKDSIATILLALENNEPLDRVVFSEVMFDISRNISGEIPEHIEWIYSTAIPKLEQMGVKVDIVRADTDYMYWFHHIPNGKYKGKKEGFLIGGMCKLNSMCKVRPIKQYYKQFADFELVKYIGIAIDEPERLKRLRGGKLVCWQNMVTPSRWRWNYAEDTTSFHQSIKQVLVAVVGFVRMQKLNRLPSSKTITLTYGKSLSN